METGVYIPNSEGKLIKVDKVPMELPKNIGYTTYSFQMNTMENNLLTLKIHDHGKDS